MKVKFFVSYSRSVKSEVQVIMNLLQKTGYEVWWDGDIPVIADWWATILDNIEWCNVFIFVISEKSVQSPYCLAELKYATARNRAILPIIIDDSTRYTIPPQVTPMRQQWLEYDRKPENMLAQIVKSCSTIDWTKYNDMQIVRPPEPNTGTGSLARRYQQAYDLAEEGHFQEAAKRLQDIASIDKDRWRLRCNKLIRRLRLYEEVVELADHRVTFNFARDVWQTYVEIADDIRFDPFDLESKLGKSSIAGKVKTPSLVAVLKALLSEPFDLIEIPEGKVTVNGIAEIVSAFQITKYPITNELFQKFVNVEGYRNQRWWTFEGWQQKEWESWQEPLYWHYTELNQAKSPVVGISWHEAVAFCLWLSDITGDKITLPTTKQWQRAAQGNDDRVYPWGNKWGRGRCNNSVGKGNDRFYMTTLVTQYEGKHKSNSYFDVVDMAGNVWEWCQTIYGTDSEELEDKAPRVIRGGAWNVQYQEFFRCDLQLWSDPWIRNDTRGFRIVLNHE